MDKRCYSVAELQDILGVAKTSSKLPKKRVGGALGPKIKPKDDNG